MRTLKSPWPALHFSTFYFLQLYSLFASGESRPFGVAFLRTKYAREHFLVG